MFKTLYALGVTSSINVARAAAERLQSGRIMEESGEDEDEDSSCGSEESLSASEESHSSSPTHSLAWTNPTPQLHKEVLVSFPFSFPIPLQVRTVLWCTDLRVMSGSRRHYSRSHHQRSRPHSRVWRAEWNQTEEGNEQFPPPLNHQTQTRSQPQPPQPDTDQTPTPTPETSSPQPPQPDTDPTPGPPLTNQSRECLLNNIKPCLTLLAHWKTPAEEPKPPKGKTKKKPAQTSQKRTNNEPSQKHKTQQAKKPHCSRKPKKRRIKKAAKTPQNTDTNKEFAQIPDTNEDVSQILPIREVDMEATETWDAADILTYKIL
ncbi:unnamed protein product [Coregonus sp. 'balchen']|nr:unnamed protein product [Coregonus sp. 'balchen']